MPTPPPPGDDDSQPPAPAAPAGALWPLLLFVLVLMVLLAGTALAYVTWRHPGLAAPLGVALTGVTLLVTIALALARR
ncbi:hypothetical protein [Streptomyces aureoverticillatus]|uniref:hypothetical protein n=1 Tax=Streptomyces aureoverticillatus TaxID=66871 RepID=UPI0013D90AFC|nr:hypothetical protein [Streptomyces aureoverticillatus]QIB49466.1 hypothetical protein G3H79_41045 [Streptomyces aureoverticillatus]